MAGLVKGAKASQVLSRQMAFCLTALLVTRFEPSAVEFDSKVGGHDHGACFPALFVSLILDEDDATANNEGVSPFPGAAHAHGVGGHAPTLGALALDADRWLTHDDGGGSGQCMAGVARGPSGALDSQHPGSQSSVRL